MPYLQRCIPRDSIPSGVCHSSRGCRADAYDRMRTTPERTAALTLSNHYHTASISLVWGLETAVKRYCVWPLFSSNFCVVPHTFQFSTDVRSKRPCRVDGRVGFEKRYAVDMLITHVLHSQRKNVRHLSFHHLHGWRKPRWKKFGQFH